MINMINRQNPGRYNTVAAERSTAATMPAAIFCGFAHSAPLGKAAVMGVSTNPGFMVMTVTPDAYNRWRNPEVKAVTRAFALP